MSQAKTMNRSRNQLATSYAPESFFTFEGGLGACIARSAVGQYIPLSDSTLDLIFERMNEVGRAWFNAAMSARREDTKRPPVLPVQCVDTLLLDADRANFRLPGVDRFYLCWPSHMEYTPAPLAFACRTCKMFKDYETINELDKDLSNLTPDHCPNPKGQQRCDWEQLGVIFVHWSGAGNNHSLGSGSGVMRSKRSSAGLLRLRQQARRINRGSAAIGDWFFSVPPATNRSPEVASERPRDAAHAWTAQWPDRLTGSCRLLLPSVSAYYVKSDLFIDFKDGASSSSRDYVRVVGKS
jgi:hypothetical protein